MAATNLMTQLAMQPNLPLTPCTPPPPLQTPTPCNLPPPPPETVTSMFF